MFLRLFHLFITITKHWTIYFTGKRIQLYRNHRSCNKITRVIPEIYTLQRKPFNAQGDTSVPFHRNFNSILRRDHPKISYERRAYESVNEKSLSWVMPRKTTKKIWSLNG